MTGDRYGGSSTLKLGPSIQTDPRLRSMAASLSDRARLEEPAEAWWACWLDLQRCLGLDQPRLLAAERLASAVQAGMGGEPLRELSVERLRAMIRGAITTEALPAPVAAILAMPGDAAFFGQWVALAQIVGVGPSASS